MFGAPLPRSKRPNCNDAHFFKNNRKGRKIYVFFFQSFHFSGVFFQHFFFWCFGQRGESFTEEIENSKVGNTCFFVFPYSKPFAAHGTSIVYIFLTKAFLRPGAYCIPQPTLVRWVVSQVPIVYPIRSWFAGWSARFLLYTPTDPGLLIKHLKKEKIRLKYFIHSIDFKK